MARAVSSKPWPTECHSIPRQRDRLTRFFKLPFASLNDLSGFQQTCLEAISNFGEFFFRGVISYSNYRKSTPRCHWRRGVKKYNPYFGCSTCIVDIWLQYPFKGRRSPSKFEKMTPRCQQWLRAMNDPRRVTLRSEQHGESELSVLNGSLEFLLIIHTL